MFIKYAEETGKKIVVVMQSGSAMILGEWRHSVPAIIQMWLGGESAGGAIADVLCGVTNPSGKLSETFPTKVRTDLEYPGNEFTIEYSEKLFVGYRYYDKHPEEIVYPFGHGLSYTEFEYSDIETIREGDKMTTSFTLKNTGKVKGAGEERRVKLAVDIKDMGYYNILLKDWVTEPGKYIIYVGSSSRDIRLEKEITITDDAPYTLNRVGDSMIG